MYSFQYGGNIPAYFQRYPATCLKARTDIPAHAGISDADRIASPRRAQAVRGDFCFQSAGPGRCGDSPRCTGPEERA